MAPCSAKAPRPSDWAFEIGASCVHYSGKLVARARALTKHTEALTKSSYPYWQGTSQKMSILDHRGCELAHRSHLSSKRQAHLLPPGIGIDAQVQLTLEGSHGHPQCSQWARELHDCH